MKPTQTELEKTLHESLLNYEDAFAILDGKVRNIHILQKNEIATLTEKNQFLSDVYNRDVYALEAKVEKMQEVIDTAIMFMQGNELFIKAGQIRAMSEALKGESQ